MSKPLRRTPIPRSPLPQRRTPIRKGVLRRTRDPEADREWALLRQRCKDRAAGWCQAKWDERCFVRGYHAHHVRPRGRGGANGLGNLLWVCAYCHEQIHMNPADAEQRGLLRASTT